MSRDSAPPRDVRPPANARVAVIAARWNPEIVDALLTGCVDRLRTLGFDDARLAVHRVPGAFELPVAAKMAAATHQFDAVILIGCVIRGDTSHFEYVAGSAASGITKVGTDTGVPCIFGVLTVENKQQALDRAGGSHGHAGVAAADAAVEMIALAAALKASDA